MTNTKRTAPAGRWDDGILVAEIEKNSREVYRVTRRTFKSYRLVDVRVWYDDPDTGEPRPGKGVAIKAELLPQIIAALRMAATGDAP